MSASSPETAGSEERSTARQPVHEIRVGTVKAAIWPNKTQRGYETYSITFSRLYKNDDGEWRSTTKNWGRNDLFSLVECARLVHVWIANRGMRNQSCPISQSQEN